MINKVALALIFSFLSANQALAYKDGATLEEKSAEDRCVVVNSLVKKQAEDFKDAAPGIVKKVPNESDLYSVIFTYKALTGAAKLEPTKKTTERVRNADQVYNDLEKGLFKGDAKDKALSSTFYEVNMILKGSIIEADKLYPECNIFAGGAMTDASLAKALGSKPIAIPNVRPIAKPTSNPAAQPASSSSPVR